LPGGLSAKALLVFLSPELEEGEDIHGLAFPGRLNRSGKHAISDAAASVYDLNRFAVPACDFLLAVAGRQVVAISLHNDLLSKQ